MFACEIMAKFCVYTEFCARKESQESLEREECRYTKLAILFICTLNGGFLLDWLHIKSCQIFCLDFIFYLFVKFNLINFRYQISSMLINQLVLVSATAQIMVTPVMMKTVSALTFTISFR
jgi:hypothetical protein